MVPVILDVDDEDLVLTTRGMVLRSAGYHVISAKSGPDALKVLAFHDLDLILLDYHMPHMNGGLVAIEIKRQWPSIPIIMISAYTDQPNAVLETVDKFVEKGAGPEFLLKRIAEVLSTQPGGLTKKKVPGAIRNTERENPPDGQNDGSFTIGKAS